MNNITICLTSCGRYDLLERTIKSLVKHWDGPPPQDFFIYEDRDMGQQKQIDFHLMVDSLLPEDWPLLDVRFGKVGQIKAADAMLQAVETPLVFWCEDDWEFTAPGFIEASKAVLAQNPKYLQVWIRRPNDRNGHPATGPIRKLESAHYQFLATNYRGKWHGFSFNPGLRRLCDYKEVFPNGFQEFAHFDPKAPWEAEAKIGYHFARAGFRAVTLLRGYVEHIGGGRHVTGE